MFPPESGEHPELPRAPGVPSTRIDAPGRRPVRSHDRHGSGCRRTEAVLGCRGFATNESPVPGARYRRCRVSMRHIVVLLLLFAVAGTAAAQDAAPVIKEIKVVGALTVGSRQVLAWSGFEEGKPLTRDLAAQGIRNLFATKKFADVYVYTQPVDGGRALIVNLHGVPADPLRPLRGQRQGQGQGPAGGLPGAGGAVRQPGGDPARPAAPARPLLREGLLQRRGQHGLHRDRRQQHAGPGGHHRRGPQGQGQVHHLRRATTTWTRAACAAP